MNECRQNGTQIHCVLWDLSEICNRKYTVEVTLTSFSNSLLKCCSKLVSDEILVCKRRFGVREDSSKNTLFALDIVRSNKTAQKPIIICWCAFFDGVA